MTRLAAVTGATGFLGRHLVAELLEAGWRVRALARRDPGPTLGAAETVRGDLDDAAALARLSDGADVVIHVAGLVKARRRREFFAVNAEGAGRLADVAAAAGVGRFVLVSSLAAREPQLSDYAASKRAGEAAVVAAMGARACVLRPPAIYGPGDRETLGIFRAAAASPVLPVFDLDARIAMIHVEDAARQIAAAAAAATLQGSPLALSDSRPGGYAWREIVEAAAEAVGRRPRLLRLPAATLHWAGALGSASRAFGANPILTLGKAREVSWGRWSIGESELWADAPRARFDLKSGFAHTVAAWRYAQTLAR